MNYSDTYSLKGWGITAGVSGFRYPQFHLGLGYQYFERDTRYYGGGILLKCEWENYYTSSNLQSINTGASVFFLNRFISFYFAMNQATWFKDKVVYASFRPEIGYGIGFCHLTYSRNITGRKASGEIPANQFILSFFIPVKNKKKVVSIWQ